jgi:1,2-phenylacetyl-CoA epoxidase PaaB subunit
MKANKALKRLARIEELVSDVTDRYDAGAPSIREALRDAKDAVTRAKEAVSLHVSSTATNSPVKSSKPVFSEKSRPGLRKGKQKLSAEGTPAKKEAPKRTALKKRW